MSRFREVDRIVPVEDEDEIGFGVQRMPSEKEKVAPDDTNVLISSSILPEKWLVPRRISHLYRRDLSLLRVFRLKV